MDKLLEKEGVFDRTFIWKGLDKSKNILNPATLNHEKLVEKSMKQKENEV